MLEIYRCGCCRQCGAWCLAARRCAAGPSRHLLALRGRRGAWRTQLPRRRRPGAQWPGGCTASPPASCATGLSMPTSCGAPTTGALCLRWAVERRIKWRSPARALYRDLIMISHLQTCMVVWIVNMPVVVQDGADSGCARSCTQHLCTALDEIQPSATTARTSWLHKERLLGAITSEPWHTLTQQLNAPVDGCMLS